MMMRSNLRASGIVDGPRPYQGAYAARFKDGGIIAAAAHYWTGNIVFFAPGASTDLARFLTAHTARPIMGLIGPWADCIEAVAGLNVHHRTIDRPPHREILYELTLAALVPPAGDVVVRRATRDALQVLISWRVNYEIETLKYAPSPEVDARAEEVMTRLVDAGDCWLALKDGTPVAMTAFNGRLPEMVQVGGVHTPKPLRGRGYARAAVAGSLLDARREGARQAILFTEEQNLAARHVYELLGFKPIGDYGLILLHPEQS